MLAYAFGPAGADLPVGESVFVRPDPGKALPAKAVRTHLGIDRPTSHRNPHHRSCNMGTTAIVIIIVAVVLLAAAAVAFPLVRRNRLRSRFGPEYDRVVQEHGRRDGEKQLTERERRYRDLDVRELSPEAREKYSMEWAAVQERFVDQPQDAVAEADELITRLMHERGYPTGAHDKRMELLSVRHANTLEHYRAAHSIGRRAAAGEAGTEDLRQAMIHHRALFDDLLGAESHTPKRPTHDGSTAEWKASDGNAADGKETPARQRNDDRTT
jgi:hypothetical protein